MYHQARKCQLPETNVKGERLKMGFVPQEELSPVFYG